MIAGMRVSAIVQARTRSSRLKNKVFLELAGLPVLEHVCQHIASVKHLDDLVIATTDDVEEDPIAEFCQQTGRRCFRYDGDIDDVLGRYVACVNEISADIVVVVCSDCPLIYPPTITRLIEALAENTDYEYARLSGDSTEGGVGVVRASVFRTITSANLKPRHREHALLYLFEHPEQFKTIDVEADKRLCGIKHRLWIDTPSDYDFLSTVFNRFHSKKEGINMVEVVEALKHEPELTQINKHVIQKPVEGYFPKLNFQVEKIQSDKSSLERIGEIAKSFIEKYQYSVLIIDDNAGRSGFWGQQGLSCASTLLHSITVEFDSGDAFVLKNKSKGFTVLWGLNTGLDWNVLIEQLDQVLKNNQRNKAALAQIKNDSQSCAICKSDKQHKFYKFSNQSLLSVCAQCSHIYVLPSDLKSVEGRYQDYGQSYSDAFLLNKNNPAQKYAEDRLLILNSYLKTENKRVLEVGCGYGYFLTKLPDSNYRVGIEPSLISCQFCVKHISFDEIWNIDYDDFYQSTGNLEKFDALCSFHVIEHLDDPRDFLVFANRQLKKGAYLMLAFPELMNASDDFIEIGYYLTGTHLHLYHRDEIITLLKQHGFETIYTKVEPSTDMLRSSFLLLARKVSSIQNMPNGKAVAYSPTENAKECALRYIERIEKRIESLQKSIVEHSQTNKPIVFYGAGAHTRALIMALDLSYVTLLIVDDDPSKKGTQIMGFDIYPSEKLVNLEFDLIILSSLVAEVTMEMHLRKLGIPESKILRLYS